MIALIGRSFGRIRTSFVAVLVILSGFQVTLIAVAGSFWESGNFERLSQLVPSMLQPALAPALTSFDRMTMLGYFDPLVVMMVVQWAIYVGTEPAGDIEAGLVDLILARPLPRHVIITRSLVLTVGSTLLLALGMCVGTLLGLALLAPAQATWPAADVVLLMAVHLTLLAWCFGAVALAAAGWSRRRGSALAVVAIAAVALYLLDFLGLWWSPAEALARFTPFAYFHGGPLLAGTANPLRDITVLGLTTVAITACAYVRFGRRDL